MRRILSLLQDHPIVVTSLALVLVIIHWSLVTFGPLENTWEPLLRSPDGGIAIYLGSASAAAIVAGFAGVVVVFGLTAGGSRFRQLRLEGSESLTRNWTSASISGFAAAGLSLAAAVISSIDLGWISPWLFEASMLLLIHGTVRIIWLLRALMGVVYAEDAAADRFSKTKPTMNRDDFS